MLIVDIDNTLAKTREYQFDNQNMKLLDVGSLLIYENIKNIIKNRSSNGLEVIIMTARPLKSFLRTKRWLKKHNINYNYLFFVKHPSHKVSLVENIGGNFEIYDDLTYGSPGNTKSYKDVVKQYKSMSNVVLCHGKGLERVQNHVD
ncbi:hypothetical protein N9I32_01625 [Porticoccaceae bacterium]|nr:hypothetical protein [Porticoccaceae bacterium]